MDNKEKTALPQAFLDKMEKLLGEEFEAFRDSYEEERKFGLRVNPLKGMKFEDTGRKRIPWSEEGYYYEASERPGKHPLHEAGLYYIQEPSAMAVAEALKPLPGERILDLCAAPGGKTTHLAGKMKGKGLLVSNEIHPQRAKILSQNVERMGIINAVVTNEAPDRLVPYFRDFFDGIVVDAPCSGEGMFRKDENARNEWSPDHVKMCAERQDMILDAAAEMLCPGGRIAYSTCTFSPEENEGSIMRFLERHPDYHVVRPEIADWFSSGRPEFAGGGEELSDTVRIWPHKNDGEGHFLALLRKDGERLPDPVLPKGKEKQKKKRNGGEEEQQKLLLDTMIDEIFLPGTERAAGKLIPFGDHFYLLPEFMPSFDGLKVLRPGLHLGTLKKGRMEPSHALALASHKEDVRRSAEIGTGDLALRYLRGEALSEGETVFTGDGKNGYVLMTADGVSIGFSKYTGGTLKNHYPKGLRIF